MPVTDAELTSLAQSHDIISLGMLADERAAPAARRRRTTFVRVATVASDVGAPDSTAGGGRRAADRRRAGEPRGRGRNGSARSRRPRAAPR